MDLEARMVEFLEGKFFWHPSKEKDERMCDASREIINAQKKFRPKKKFEPPTPKDLEKLSEERLVLLAKKKELAATERAENLNSKLEFAKLTLEAVLQSISELHDISADDILSGDRQVDIMNARHHLIWSLLRYIPNVSFSLIGKMLGRDHATIINSRKRFERRRDRFKFQIEAMDKIMGYVPG